MIEEFHKVYKVTFNSYVDRLRSQVSFDSYKGSDMGVVTEFVSLPLGGEVLIPESAYSNLSRFGSGFNSASLTGLISGRHLASESEVLNRLRECLVNKLSGTDGEARGVIEDLLHMLNHLQPAL